MKELENCHDDIRKKIKEFFYMRNLTNKKKCKSFSFYERLSATVIIDPPKT